ncbi:MAG: RNA polymerase sporulation sigma factor SigH [Clostridiales bacterium]|nr:RNA polymerase sporulation sigma factor SigH [Clostridiales bacterium]
MTIKEDIFNTMTDARIISLARNGNDGAMDFILHKYRYLAKAKSRAYFLVGAEHEDLIQEGMIGLYKAVKDYNPTKTPLFFSFAELCITRQILTAIKAATRQKHQPLNSYISLNKPIKGEEERTLADILYLYSNRNPEEMIISKETTVDLMFHINDNLSKMENEVLTLYLKGEDYMHISELLNKTPKSIDNALQRIKKKISIIAGNIVN